MQSNVSPKQLQKFSYSESTSPGFIQLPLSKTAFISKLQASGSVHPGIFLSLDDLSQLIKNIYKNIIL